MQSARPWSTYLFLGEGPGKPARLLAWYLERVALGGPTGRPKGWSPSIRVHTHARTHTHSSHSTTASIVLVGRLCGPLSNFFLSLFGSS